MQTTVTSSVNERFFGDNVQRFENTIGAQQTEYRVVGNDHKYSSSKAN